MGSDRHLHADVRRQEAPLTRAVLLAVGVLAVVTLPDLAGRDVAEVALRIGREWKVGANAPIGAEARNTGIVILVVPKETSRDGRGYVRIEVGQGTEGF